MPTTRIGARACWGISPQHDIRQQQDPPVPEFRPRILFVQGAKEIIAWYDADPARRTVDEGMDRLMDELIAR